MGGVPAKWLFRDHYCEGFFVGVKELRQCILRDEIDTLDQKLKEISASGDCFIRSVLSYVDEDENINQTLLMTAIREKSEKAFDLLMDYPVEFVH